MKIIVAILIFSFIIIFHEFGHFLLARLNGVKVNEFCLGLGPTIFKIKGKKTDFCLKLLPFGGACIMEGEDGVSDDPGSFNNKNVWQRFSIVVAGPLFNIILAFILSVVLIGLSGVNEPVITGVVDGYSAKEQGLQAGDRIVKLGNYNIHFYNEISIYTYFHYKKDIDVVFERDGVKYTAKITPKYEPEKETYLLGVYGDNHRVKVGPIRTLEYGLYEIKYEIYMTLQSLSSLVTGQVKVNELSGPVGIVDTVGEIYEQAKEDGAYYIFLNMLNIAILLTANLGVMNLLPIPALDGGRIILYIVEMIRGKRMNENIEGYIHLVGFGLLMALMVVVMFNDIARIFNGI